MHRPELAAGGPGRAVAHLWLWRLGRAFGASLLLLVMVGAGVAAAADIGHEDFAASGDTITGSKPESKLWYNDGTWWASMWSTSAADFYIYRLATGTETWIRTATALDNRSGTRADTLWDGTHLYVASQHVEEDGGETGTGSSYETRLYRYSYNTTSNTYSLDGGFPASMRTGVQSETLVIAKDSTGTLWATWTLAIGGVNSVYTNHTLGGNDATWSAPSVMPATGAVVANDDISSIIAFTVGGQRRVGVFWSNQLEAKDYFAWQPDGGPDNDWTAETALAASGGNPLPADDHMNLKTDSSGKVYAVVKTSNTESSQPRIQLLDRSTGGAWSAHTVGRVTDSNTRAILELDASAAELHVFMTGRHGGADGQEGGDIYEKTSPTSGISFAVGSGTLVIRDDSSGDMNNATSTKQNLNAATGIVLLAYNDATNVYWHHHEVPPAPPVAQFTGAPTSGARPLAVSFTNTSTGTEPLTYAWNFGDPGSGGSNTSTARNPSHTYSNAGTYTVTLTVTNAAGSNAMTRTGYITVLAPPDANFTGAPTSGTSPLAVTFTNTSTGSSPLTYAWNFGDPSSGSNNTSTLQNPIHTYNPGTYSVTLTASNAAGSNVMTRTNYITVSAPPGSRFNSITPTRVLDSRSNVGLNGVFNANAARSFVVADGTPIPTNAVAVTGNLTVTGQTKGGYIVLAPAAGGATSTLNFPVGDTRANGVTVALGTGGTLNATYKATAGATTHLVFDVTGYFR
jgi:PKD repeat protein